MRSFSSCTRAGLLIQLCRECRSDLWPAPVFVSCRVPIQFFGLSAESLTFLSADLICVFLPLSFAASAALDPPVDFSCAAVDPDTSCRQVPVRLHGCRSCYTPVSLLSALDLDVRLESLLSAFGFPVPVKKLCASLLCSLGFGFVLYCRFKAVTSPALIKCCSSKSIFLIACELLQVEASLLLSRQIKRLKVSCLICTPAVISQTRTPGVW
jgi:hypothetical protein